SDSKSEAELKRAIEWATTPGQSLDCPQALLVERRSMKRAYQVVVSPVRRRFRQFGGMRAPAVVVLITDPDNGASGPVQLLMRLYGLTKKEAAVAPRLLGGRV